MTDSATVRVATWNLWWRHGDWEARQPAILECLRDLDADIVGWQSNPGGDWQMLGAQPDGPVRFAYRFIAGLPNQAVSSLAAAGQAEALAPAVVDSRAAAASRRSGAFGAIRH